MRQIPVVALASTLLLAGLAAACRDGMKAPVEPTVALSLVPVAPSAPYRPAKLTSILQSLAAKSTASASRAPSATSGMKPNFTVVDAASSDATTMSVNGLVSLNPGGIASSWQFWGPIGNSGVTGSGSTADGYTHAFFWSLVTNSGKDLGTLPSGTNSAGEGVNDKGDVVGWSEVDPNAVHHAFIAIGGGTLKDIGTLDPSTPGAWVNAYAINNADQVVGSAEGQDGHQHAFMWDAATGTMHDIQPLGDNFQALGISDDGVVMGSYSDASGNDRTWTWRNGDNAAQPLDIFPSMTVFPIRMNARGQISGFVVDGGAYKGFFYDPAKGTAVEFGNSFESLVLGMNNQGDVVGITVNDAGTAFVPILWSSANQLQDLSPMLPSLPMLWGINDNYQVLVPPNLIYQLTIHPAPVVTDASVQTAMNTAVSVTVSASDPDGEDITYDGTTQPQHGTVTGTGPNYTYTPNTDFSGSDSFDYTVSDEKHVAATGHVTITVISNRPPVAVAGGNNLEHNGYTGAEGSAIAFAGSGSDPDGDAITYAWDFGDGATADGASASHAYADNGTYTAKLTVTDSHGASASAAAQVVVTNVAPTGTFSATPTSLDEGSSFALAIANATDASSVDQKAGLQYAFDCGAGYGGWVSTASINCGAADNAVLVVHAKVRDKDGGATQYEAHVTVNNVAPSVSIDPPATVVSGGVYALSGSFSDKGVNDGPWSYAVDWGNTSSAKGIAAAQGAISASQQYLAAGTYTVTLAVTDKDKGTGTASRTVTVVRLPVDIDIVPGDASNAIKLNANAERDILVAVLSSATFDARLVDIGSARIGGAAVAAKGNFGYFTSVQDVNGDGRPDMVLHFNLSDLMAVGGLNASSTSLTVLANLTDGRQITGTDVVKPQ